MKREIVHITCDQCQATGATEVRWGLRGHDFGVDLCESCMSGFDTLLAPYLQFSHKIKPAPYSMRRDAPGRTVQVASADELKPKRKRRTKAEMEMARQAESVAVA